MTFVHIGTPIPIPQLERVVIDGKRHYETPDGVFPSITTILKDHEGKGLKRWRKMVGEEEANRISKRTANLGTEVHLIVEKYLKNDPDATKNLLPDAKAMFLSLRPFLHKINNIHCQEQAMWSKLGVAGTNDIIGEYDGVPSIIDIKSAGTGGDKEGRDLTNYYVQLAAYRRMYQELVGMRLPQAIILPATFGYAKEYIIKGEELDKFESIMEERVIKYRKDHGYV